MKIIARSGANTFLVEAEAHEIGCMFGEKYKRPEDLKIGMEFAVSKLFQHNESLRTASKQVELIRTTLHALDQTLSVLEPEIKTITEGSDS